MEGARSVCTSFGYIIYHTSVIIFCLSQCTNSCDHINSYKLRIYYLNRESLSNFVNLIHPLPDMHIIIAILNDNIHISKSCDDSV